MRHRRGLKRVHAIILLLTVLLLALGSLALAQVTNPRIDWWTVDGGGGMSSADVYTLEGTVGQADANSLSDDGRYAVSGGFWGGASPSTSDLFLPIVHRQ